MHLRFSTLIQKPVFGNILCLAVDITFLMLMFQIFIGILLRKIKKFGAS